MWCQVALMHSFYVSLCIATENLNLVYMLSQLLPHFMASLLYITKKYASSTYMYGKSYNIYAFPSQTHGRALASQASTKICQTAIQKLDEVCKDIRTNLYFINQFSQKKSIHIFFSKIEREGSVEQN